MGGGGGGGGGAAKEYAAGFAAGVATVIVGHPFDTVKVKLQAHNTKTQVKEYKNALHCTSRILISEGVKGLYKGAALWQLVAAGPGGVQSTRPQLQVIIPSAAYGGAIISLILGPTELLKCRMQVQGTGSSTSNNVRYAGPLDCALKTVNNEGIKGIFRGGLTTLLRESIGNSVFFCTYEFSRYYMHLQLDSTTSTHGNRPKLLTDVGIGILSGGLSGIAFWSAVLPLDVAKTVIQTAPDVNSNRNPFQTLVSIYRRVGLRGCYAGLGPTFVRAFPANAAAIVTWEFTAKLLGVRRE